MILTSFVIQGCGDSETKSEVKLSKVDKAIKDYYTKELGDPTSYSVVSSSKLSSDGLKELYKHTFRARNKYNALELKTEYVYYDLLDKKVIIAISEDTFTGFLKFMRYGEISSSNYNYDYHIDYLNLFMPIGIVDNLLSKYNIKDREMWVKLGKYYQYANPEKYKKLSQIAKSLPLGGYAGIIFLLMRVSPELTADAIMDANNLK